MKKSIVTIIVVLVVMTFAFSAYAQRMGKMGGCGGYGGGCGGYGELCPNFQGGSDQYQYAPMSQDEAKSRIEAYVKTNFKGYTVTGIKSVQTYRGTAYAADAKDASGNLFNFFVGPNGIVRGPIHNAVQ